jgi:hypothetical protein
MAPDRRADFAAEIRRSIEAGEPPLPPPGRFGVSLPRLRALSAAALAIALGGGAVYLFARYTCATYAATADRLMRLTWLPMLAVAPLALGYESVLRTEVLRLPVGGREEFLAKVRAGGDAIDARPRFAGLTGPQWAMTLLAGLLPAALGVGNHVRGQSACAYAPPSGGGDLATWLATGAISAVVCFVTCRRFAPRTAVQRHAVPVGRGPEQ